MADETTPASALAADPEDTPALAATTTPDALAADGQTISLEAARKLRSEAESMRKRLKAFEDKEAALTAAQLTEQERLQKQYADLQSKYDADLKVRNDRIIRYEVERQAVQAGIRPDAADDAAKLLDWSQLTYGDDGTPTNAQELLKELLKNKPWLAAQTTPARTGTAGGATNPSRSTGNGELSMEVITKMTPEQYNARRAEIQTWMQAHPGKRL